ncbi:MAG: hypothetical protein KBS60_02890 [Phascolarctobacterium sp.]|nr:hypothetical protein [Candidatus Phascolarctobacterium caballi]
MVNKDLIKYIRENWMKYLEYISDISRGGKNSCSLVNIPSEMSFAFDAIVADMFSVNKKPMSVDMVDFDNQWIVFTEFKGGFYDKINDKTYVPQNCKYISNYLCPELKPFQKKRRESEKKELVSSIVQKAVEAYMFIHIFILPKCSDLANDTCQKIKLVIVYDGDIVDNAISIAKQYCKDTSLYENKVWIEQALKRFVNDSCVGVEDFYYDKIEVYDKYEYEARFKMSMSESLWNGIFGVT